MKIFETRPGASWYIEESNKIAFLEIQAQISPLECLKVKLPRYRHTVAPTHFQKQVGRGTWLERNGKPVEVKEPTTKEKKKLIGLMAISGVEVCTSHYC